jgi:hypothetical protein
MVTKKLAWLAKIILHLRCQNFDGLFYWPNQFVNTNLYAFVSCRDLNVVRVF